jgi:cytochrome c oxidase subunit 1
MALALALMFHEIGARAQTPPNSGSDKLGFPVYLVGGLIFTIAFLDAGHASVPRRMAEHLPAWIPTDEAGSIGAILVLLAMLYFSIRITAGLLKASPPDSGRAARTSVAAG